jgi:hypothetical protein
MIDKRSLFTTEKITGFEKEIMREKAIRFPK